MKEFIKQLWNRITVGSEPRKVCTLSADNAQSQVYYRKKYSYEIMLVVFRKHIFKTIDDESYNQKLYAIINIPEWLSNDSYTAIKKELVSLKYNIRDIEELRLLIIYWK